MSDKWLLVFQVRPNSWLLQNLFDIVFEIFVVIICLGGMFTGIGFLLGFVSIPAVNSSTPDWQFYGMLVLSMLFGSWLAWTGLRDARDQFLAIFSQPLIFEGTLEERTLVERSGVRLNFWVWELKFAEQTWEIYKRDVDHSSFSTIVTEGSKIRIQYRQGTKQITHLWAKTKNQDTLEMF